GPARVLRFFCFFKQKTAYEIQMDMMAERLSLDPTEFRRKNLLRDGDSFATGENLDGMHYDELLNQAAASVNWTTRDSRWLVAPRATDSQTSLRRGKSLAFVINVVITHSTSAAALK